MANKVLTARPDESQGTVRLIGAGVPNSSVVVTRTVGKGQPQVVRGGEFTSSTSGFVLTDSEPSLGVGLLYRVTATGIGLADRFIQSNRVLNPRAGTNLANAAAGTNRVFTRETSPDLSPRRDAVTSFKIGNNTNPTLISGTPGLFPATTLYPGASVYPQDTSPPMPDFASRKLLEITPSGLAAGDWFVSGQFMYDSPDLWLWQDAKSNGTWGALKNKGSWLDVRSEETSSADEIFASLWAAVTTSTGTIVVAPFQVLGVTDLGGNTWKDFSFNVTLPPSAPANCKLVLLQGPTARELACTFWLSTLMVSPAAEVSVESLPYFDGSTPVPANPAAAMIPDYAWSTASNDAYIAWNGTPENSVSVFYGPSAVTAVDTVLLGTGGAPPTTCEPVLMSDPVLPSLSIWFSLLGISALTFNDRSALYDVLSKGPQIAVSQARAWASGQLTMLTSTLEEATLAEEIFATGRVLLYRNPDPAYPENDWYLHIGAVVQERLSIDHRKPERRWAIPFVRVERPVGLIAASTGITWQQIKAGFGSWGGVKTVDWLRVASQAPTGAP